MVLLFLVIIFLVIFIVCITVYFFVDNFYVKPIADTSANDYCKSLGFNQYKTFSRIGLWSENPVGIKCEYAERYTDLGVRINSPT